MAKHFGGKLEKWYFEFCPKCHGHNTGELRIDKARKMKMFYCKQCGFYYGYEGIKDDAPKYYNLDKTQKREGK